MSVVDEVLDANSRYAAGFTLGELPVPPGRALAVLVCMDARIDPAKALGLREGDAHVIRNAGGRASDDAIRSLVISQRLLGTREVLVVHHTDCGMTTFTNQQLRQRLREETGADASEIDFLPFADLERSVWDDVARIKGSPFIIPGTPVTGLIYDVKTGSLLRMQ